MTDTPDDIAHRFDKFTMPCDIPDGDGEAGSDRSAGGLRSPPSRGLPQEYGVPTQDWLSRGLKSKAGRGWEAEAPYGDPDPDPGPDEDPYYGLSYDYGQDPRSAAQGSADPAAYPAAKTPYDHYPSSAALLQARRAGRMGGSGRNSAAPHWPGGWLPGDPPREIVLDSDPWADPCSGPGDPTPANAKFGAAQQVRFLDGLALHGNVRAAAARVGVSRDTVYRLRRREPAFANLWEAALVHARAAGEAELASRAFDGVAVPVFCRGEHVATWRRHDPRYLLTHLARLDRRIAQNGGAEDEAQARAECFDTLLAGRAGQSVPEHHARAAQLGARLAAEDCEPAWPETGTAAGEAPPAPAAPVAPVGADLPPSRLGVFGLACEEALEAQEAAVAAGRKDYRDAAARHRADDRAVERATAKALARFEQWQTEGRELLDRVLAGEAGEGEAGEGEAGEGEAGEGGVPQGDGSGVAPASQGDALAAGSVSVSSGLADEAASECAQPEPRRDPVSQVSAAPGSPHPGTPSSTTGTYMPKPKAEVVASSPTEASTVSSSSRLSQRRRTKGRANRATIPAAVAMSPTSPSVANSGGAGSSGNSTSAKVSAASCASARPIIPSTTNLRCAK